MKENYALPKAPHFPFPVLYHWLTSTMTIFSIDSWIWQEELLMRIRRTHNKHVGLASNSFTLSGKSDDPSSRYNSPSPWVCFVRGLLWAICRNQETARIGVPGDKNVFQRHEGWAKYQCESREPTFGRIPKNNTHGGEPLSGKEHFCYVADNFKSSILASYLRSYIFFRRIQMTVSPPPIMRRRH